MTDKTEVCNGLTDANRRRNYLINRIGLIERPATQSVRTDLRLRDPNHPENAEKSYRLASKLWKAIHEVMKELRSSVTMNTSPHLTAIDNVMLPDEFVQRFRDKHGGKFTNLEIEVSIKHYLGAAADGILLDFLKDQKKEIEKVIKGLAEQLPAAEWWCSHRDCNLLGLGKVIGETGNLSNYSTPGKVKKRMGLVPIRGKACSTWMRQNGDGKGLTKEEWVAIGYVKRRRSVMYQIGVAIVVQKKGENKYRALYLEEKAHKAEQKKDDEDWTPKHIDLHSHRRMLQRLVIDLWMEWHGK